MAPKIIAPGAALLLLLALAAPAHAELLTPEQAVAQALRHNPELAAARAQALAAGARRDVAAGARLPEVGAAYVARRSDNPLDAFADKLNRRVVTSADFDPAKLNDPADTELHATQLAVRVPVYHGGRIVAESDAASAQAQAARLQYERARELTAFEAERAYRELQAAEEGLHIAADAVAAAEEHARTTAQLVREGRTVQSDRLTAEVQLAAMRGAREQAVTRVARARDRLRLVMGVAIPTALEIVPLGAPAAPSLARGPRTRVPDVPPTTSPIGDDAALTHRKDLEAERALATAAHSRVRAARAAHLPRVDVMAARNWFDDSPGFESHSTSVMGVVSFDLYAGGRQQRGIEAAAAEREAQELRLRAAEDRVRDDVRAAHERLREAQARHAIARDNVERARETVRLVKQRYGQGRTILIDLLQAERALVDTRHEELSSRVAVEIGANAVRLAEGTLPLPEEVSP
jgi:outer membrane protein TolC